MAEQKKSGKEGEQMLPLATLVIDAVDGVLLGMGGRWSQVVKAVPVVNYKIFSLAGLRLGYKCCQPQVFDGFQLCKSWGLHLQASSDVKDLGSGLQGDVSVGLRLDLDTCLWLKVGTVSFFVSLLAKEDSVGAVRLVNLDGNELKNRWIIVVFFIQGTLLALRAPSQRYVGPVAFEGSWSILLLAASSCTGCAAGWMCHPLGSTFWSQGWVTDEGFGASLGCGTWSEISRAEE